METQAISSDRIAAQYDAAVRRLERAVEQRDPHSEAAALAAIDTLYSLRAITEGQVIHAMNRRDAARGDQLDRIRPLLDTPLEA